MARSGTADRKTVEAILKSLLLLERAVEEVLDSRAVVAACGSYFSPSKVRMLKLILHSGKQSVGQVARFLGVSDPAASQLAEALVRQKLIVRHADPKDRRTAYLRLTPAGRRLTRSVEQEQRHRVRLALRDAGTARSKEWSSFLRKVTQSLTQAEQAFGEYCLQCGSHEDTACILEDGGVECLYHARSARRSRGPRSTKKTPPRRSGKKAASSARRRRA